MFPIAVKAHGRRQVTGAKNHGVHPFVGEHGLGIFDAAPRLDLENEHRGFVGLAAIAGHLASGVLHIGTHSQPPLPVRRVFHPARQRRDLLGLFGVGEADPQRARVEQPRYKGTLGHQDRHHRRKAIVPGHDQEVGQGFVVVDHVLVFDQQHIVPRLGRDLNHRRAQRLKDIEAKERTTAAENFLGRVADQRIFFRHINPFLQSGATRSR